MPGIIALRVTLTALPADYYSTYSTADVCTQRPPMRHGNTRSTPLCLYPLQRPSPPIPLRAVAAPSPSSGSHLREHTCARTRALTTVTSSPSPPALTRLSSLQSRSEQLTKQSPPPSTWRLEACIVHIDRALDAPHCCDGPSRSHRLSNDNRTAARTLPQAGFAPKAPEGSHKGIGG